MTIEQVKRFIDIKSNQFSRIFLKTRTVEGVFIQAPDFLELSKKNFWRIVTVSKLEEYEQSKDLSLSRIFNGQEFVRISPK